MEKHKTLHGFLSLIWMEEDKKEIMDYLEIKPKTFLSSWDEHVISWTKNNLDVAIKNDGYFIIQPKDGGSVAFSRRGDLQINENGELLDGAGNQMLDAGLQAIEIPAFRSINISPEGQIFIKPKPN